MGFNGINEIEPHKTQVYVILAGDNNASHNFNLTINRCECDVRRMSFNEIETLAITALRESFDDAHCCHHHN